MLTNFNSFLDETLEAWADVREGLIAEGREHTRG